MVDGELGASPHTAAKGWYCNVVYYRGSAYKYTK